MKTVLINQSEISMPKKFMQDWLKAVAKGLKVKNLELIVVFMDLDEAKVINKTYRKKNYATNVLSFEGAEPNCLGELVICPQVLKREAKELGFTFQYWLGYMLIHGVLHLQGYDHEKSKAEEKRMFKIQDQVFDRLCTKFDI